MSDTKVQPARQTDGGPARILVTAALPYANGNIHLGHLAGAYLPADLYVRYQRSMKRDVVFICGSDEHGVPITLTAEQEGTTPQVVVDRYHALNKSAFEKLGISFDNYSRTSLPIHHRTAQEFFLNFHANGILKEKKEKQLYDEKAGMFLPDRYVEGTCPVCRHTEARGDQCEKCGTFLNSTDLINPKSKITGETPTVRETSHWYFPLGEFEDDLKRYVAQADLRDGWKENVLQYCHSWFKEGLQDRAVTRDLQWGVKVPLKGYESKVLYVWFEAVLGYISSTKEWAERQADQDAWKRYWQDPSTKYVAFIGKDNVVFHCIVFPAMLMAWNKFNPEKYVLPANVPANEFLNYEGQKFSKSRGWGVDVSDVLESFPADPLRYALAINLPETRDADFYWKDFQARNNNELADILGNLVNRTLTFAWKNFAAKVPPMGSLSGLDAELIAQLKLTPTLVGNLYERYRFREGTLETMNLARYANKYFNDSIPWKTLDSNRQQCATTIHLCLQTVRALAILFEPVAPFAAKKIWEMLGLRGSPSDDGWNAAGELRLEIGRPLGIPDILFSKIEDEKIEVELKKLHQSNTQERTMSPDPHQAEVRPVVGIEDFRKVDLRVASVVACERVAKSEKLLKIEISFGSERRQIIAGIAQHYEPNALIGKKVIVVANLKPAKLMGLESHGMLLAATDEQGKLSILTVEHDIAEGSVVT